MKQFNFQYFDSVSFENELENFKAKILSDDFSGMMFCIYSKILDRNIINETCKVIEKIFPDVDYMGCSTSGNIVNCKLSSDITIICTVFENPLTKFIIHQFDLSADTIENITNCINKITAENPWIKAIEMYFTIPENSYTRFCNGMNKIPEDIQIFGGVACSDDITSMDSCVFTKAEGYSEKSVVIIFYGGEDFHINSMKITGWKQLKRTFRVTKSDGSILKELDGIPAYEVYRKYLDIPNDENFFSNTLEFPLFYEHDGTTILRVPIASNDDGSITMSSDIDEGSVVCLSYGDPRTVIEKIENDSQKIYEFRPDIIHIFSCAARCAFWNTNEPTHELSVLKDIAPSAGFFSHGEFIRNNGFLNQHNVTLVIISMREGEKGELPVCMKEKDKKDGSSKMPLVARLATFIAESSRELEEYNARLQFTNEKLKATSIIDGLTGLFNRSEIQTRIEVCLSDIKKSDFSLIMLDIDNFKQVNDTYGHQEGDTVIIALSDILRNEHIKSSSDYSAGRWGGEEFMMLLPDTKIATASLVAELIRKCFAETVFSNVRPQTVSLGVTQAKLNDTIDSLVTRVDSALYKAKKSGKNKVVAE
ncbi:MAG: GGDEF domain-containing protein [Ruminococcus sp.]|nr:GGDEF domain-containing protein [Ruminococcus sp.]